MSAISRNFIPEQEPIPAMPSRLDEGILRKHAQDMSFTPIIGAECPVTGRERSEEAWGFIAGEFNRLSVHPELIEEDEYDLLESLRRAKEVPNVEPPRRTPHPQALHDLRL